MLHHIIEKGNFQHFTQSLFKTSNWERIGGEILFRSELGDPDVIFLQAKQVNKLFELETKSIFKIFHTYNLQESPPKGFLFINVSPSTILNKEFPTFIKSLTVHFPKISEKVVFEIIETDYVENMNLLKEQINFVKNLGFQIAIDDVGKGWSSLHLIIELEPHFIKLDRYFSINLTTSPLKQEMIKSFLHYAHYSKTNVVLEGIEKETDLAIAKALGVDICQGFLLHKPEPIIDKSHRVLNSGSAEMRVRARGSETPAR